jgi:hypothetical protein
MPIPAADIEDLDTAIRELTQPHTTKVLQANATTSWATTIKHEPLLVRLRDAIAGGISSHGAATQGRERIPLDPGALIVWDRITERINELYLDMPAHQRQHLYVQDRLAGWYSAHRDTVTDDTESARENRRMIKGWARSIEAMFNPPSVLELTTEIRACVLTTRSRRTWDSDRARLVSHPYLTAKIDRTTKEPAERVVGHVPAQCPECGESYGHDPKTGDRVIALVVEYHDLGAETLDYAIGRCRFCERIWRGRTAIRELRWAIDNYDTPAPELQHSAA